MDDVFRVPRGHIEKIIKEMERDGLVHPETTCSKHAAAEHNYEAAYRDREFLTRLGRSGAEAEIVAAALDFLKAEGIVAPDAGYDSGAFELLRTQVRALFTVPHTTVSPVMERLIFMLTSLRHPKRLIELGCFCGNTLAWFAGPCIGPCPCYRADTVYGLDVDRDAINLAMENFARLPNADGVRLIAADARTVLDRLPGCFDMCYMEAKNEETPGVAFELLQRIDSKLAPGAWLITHDAACPSLRDEFDEYLPWVRDPSHFRRSLLFDVDFYGLELSIKGC